MKTITTMMHTYRFDLSDPAETAAYEEMQRMMAKQGLGRERCFETYGTPVNMRGKGYVDTTHPDLNDREITLELEHLFDNQWNTAPVDGISDKGLRVFDWLEFSWPNRRIKTGHWLEQRGEMYHVREQTLKCGYCGHQAYVGACGDFCDKCLDSEHLKQEDLGLLRMWPIVPTSGQKRPKITDAQLAALLPIYREAQLHGRTERGKARIAKAKKDVAEKYERTIRNAAIERDGMVWILGTLPGIASNAIYYNHTGRWGFGWREPVGGAILGDLLDAITEFPYPYDIKTADGRTLSAG